jgi:hypothetical protein
VPMAQRSQWQAAGRSATMSPASPAEAASPRGTLATEGSPMTEAQWLESTEPDKMLAFLRDSSKLSERKAQLFGCACCRRVWQLLTDERSRQAVEVAERFADGLASPKACEKAAQMSLDARDDAVDRWQSALTDIREYEINVCCAAFNVVRRTASRRWLEDVAADIAEAHTLTSSTASSFTRVCIPANEVERAAQAILLRDHFGPLPFREVPIEPSLLTAHGGLIPNLAESAYTHRQLPSGTLDPSRLGVLADAVDELGGAPEELLAHLRSPQPHTRGCWVIDLLTGKS